MELGQIIEAGAGGIIIFIILRAFYFGLIKENEF